MGQVTVSSQNREMDYEEFDIEIVRYALTAGVERFISLRGIHFHSSVSLVGASYK